MNLDTDRLRAFSGAVVHLPSAGRAPLSRFYEDEDQPRKEFDEDFLRNLASEIREAGTIHTAINVRPPDADGRMKIIHGAQRYRACALAGLADIPYLVQPDDRVFDEYSQVSENQMRRGLEPRELALFIQKRIDKGDKRKFVAKRLGIDPSAVTHHLSLLASPEWIAALYDERKCRTPKYLHRLSLLSRDHPEEVALFCATSDDFSNRAIQGLEDRLRGLLDPDTRPAAADDSARAHGATPPEADVRPPAYAIPMSAVDVGCDAAVSARGARHREVAERRVRSQARRTSANHPLLAAHGPRQVELLLNRAPSAEGLVHVNYLDDHSADEVAFDDLTRFFVRVEMA